MEQKWTIGNIVYMVNAAVLVFAIMVAGANAAHAQDNNTSAVDCDPFSKPYSASTVNLEEQMRDLKTIVTENQRSK